MGDLSRSGVSRLGGSGDPLEGKIVQMPDARGLVLSIEHEYDDGTTLRYLDGPQAGSLTMRDTFNVRKYPVVG